MADDTLNKNLAQVREKNNIPLGFQTLIRCKTGHEKSPVFLLKQGFSL